MPSLQCREKIQFPVLVNPQSALTTVVLSIPNHEGHNWPPDCNDIARAGTTPAS